MREVYEEFSDLKENVHAMQETLRAAQCALIYVEGPSDVAILKRAQAALGFNNLEIRFESSGGAGNLTAFLKASSRIKTDSRPLVGIFDSDARGRKEFKTFENSHFFGNTKLRALSRPYNIYVGCLAVPNHLVDAEKAFKAISMPIPLPIEFMFSSEVISQAVHAGVLELQPRLARIANEELPLEVSVDAAIQGRIDGQYLYLAKAISDASKIPFSDWVIARPNNEFEGFRSLFDDLQTAVG